MENKDELNELIEEGSKLKVNYIVTIEEDGQFASFDEEKPFIRSYGETPQESQDKFFFISQGVYLKEQIDVALDINDKELVQEITVAINTLKLNRMLNK